MLSLIAAVAENNCIGKNGTLPWHIPEDLAHFKRITSGKTVIMGRKTWESLPEQVRPLPGRTNVVVTRNSEYRADGAEIFDTIKGAVQAFADEPEVFIIGGGELYRQTIDMADRLYITKVHQVVDGDSFFPEISEDWKEVDRTDVENQYSFITYEH